jgi:hypothetical protein
LNIKGEVVKIGAKTEKEMVSCFKNFDKYLGDFPLGNIINGIREGKWSQEIAVVRDKKSRGEDFDGFKAKLPAFTPCATFTSERKAGKFIEYNKLVILDLDEVDVNVEILTGLHKKAIECEYTYGCFISPGGKGLKILVRVDSEAEVHKAAFEQVKKHYEALLGVQIDPSGKDLSRLCFVSEDERAVINENAQVYMVEIPVRAFEKTAFSNNDWNTGYRKYEQRFDLAIKWSKKKMVFEEGRNNFVHLLASNCKRKSIPREVTRALIKESNFNFAEREVDTAVDSAYNDLTDYGKYEYDVVPVAHVVQQKNATIKSFKQLAEEGKNLKPLKKLFGNYILEKSTTLFPSERGVGKSYLMMQLALSIAGESEEFLGESIELHGNVLYINLEMDNDLVSRRIADLITEKDWPCNYSADCLTSRKGIKAIYQEILEYCHKNKPILIIVDNLRTAFNGSDNERNSEMTSMLSFLNELKDQVKTAFVIVHHNKKGTSNQLTNSDMQSGAGALTDLVDADFFLRRSAVSNDFRLLVRKKSRNCEEQDGAKVIAKKENSLWFELIEDNVDERLHVNEMNFVDKQVRFQKIIELKNNGTNNAQIGREVGLSRSQIKRIIDSK